MNFDDEFEPKLGKLRTTPSKKARSYLQRVLRSVALAGGTARAISSKSGRRFHGSRIGRGAGAGRVLGSRDRHAGSRARRVIVKTRFVRLKGTGIKAARLHLRYIQRDGVTREGAPGTLYDAEKDRADGKEFIERTKDDRHQFRFIVSPEDGAEYQDLKHVTRRLLAQMEEDLGTKLDWVAVDHFNTGHPHTHVVLRGADDQGKDLIIAADYLNHGIRERAVEIVSLDLGPRTDLEIEQRLRAEIEQERFTSLDRGLMSNMDDKRVVRAGEGSTDALRQSLAAGRLQKLAHMGLAAEIAPGRWQLAENLEPVLRRMGERGDIIKTLHREMKERDLQRDTASYTIYDPDAAPPRLVGRVIGRGLSDELYDGHYLIVDGIDGRAHYVELGRAENVDAIPDGAVVAISPKPAQAKAVDHTVAKIAALGGGRYSPDLHLKHDTTATAEFAETHARRLEAMRRFGGYVDREPDGTWIIASDHIARATAFERRQAKINPVIVETLSVLPVERQITADGATWLDRRLLDREAMPLRESGFGREISDALALRRQWLIGQGLAQANGEAVTYSTDMLTVLRQRELARVASQLSRELGLDYVEARQGTKIVGTYRRAVDLASGKFAIIEKSREFTLVPWRPILERNLGKQVAGIMRGESISWTLGKSRSGPGIS